MTGVVGRASTTTVRRMKRGISLCLSLAVLGSLLVGPVSGATVRAPRDLFNVGAVVGSPGEAVGTMADAGAVHVFRHESPHPTLEASSSLLITRRTLGGTPQAGDRFGEAVALGDLNDDNLSDLVIGAPGADAGAGRVYVLLRQFPSGDFDLDDPVVLRQGVGGLTGSSESGDHFGAAVHVDYRSGGQGWLAIGAPGEDIGGANGAGAITIVPVGTNLAADVSYYQGNGLPGTAESGDAFGTALTGYGLGGLAIGAPGEDIGAAVDAGNVIGMAAQIGGLPGSAAETSFQQGVGGVPGTNESGDRFGAALVGRMQNAISVGAPGEDVGSIANAGAVTDIRVPEQCCVNNTSWYQGGSGLVGTAEAGDAFGSSLTATSFGGLVVGAPGEDVGAFANAGVIHVIETMGGAGPTLWATGNASFHQDSPGVPGVAETNDRFGAALGEGTNTVLVGAPTDDVGPAGGAGVVVVLRTDGSSIDTSLAGQQLHQDTPGIDSSAEAGDEFGAGIGGRDEGGHT
jgi:hypothetical protein